MTITKTTSKYKYKGYLINIQILNSSDKMKIYRVEVFKHSLLISANNISKSKMGAGKKW